MSGDSSHDAGSKGPETAANSTPRDTIRVRVCGCMDTSSLKVIRRVHFTIPYVVRGINYMRGGTMWITL